MAEWIAYADDSGTDAGSRYFTVMGYVASPHQWRGFRREWRKVLAGRPEFHSIDFFQQERWQSRKSLYHGWSLKRARNYLDALLRTIGRYGVRPIGFGYEVEPFMALTEDERKLLTGAVRKNRIRSNEGKGEVSSRIASTGAPNQPFFLGFHYIITQALKAAPGGAKVNFVFDRRKASEPRAHETFQDIVQHLERDDLRERIGLLSFGDSTEYEPLQAADLYAYTSLRWLHDSFTQLVVHAIEKLARRRPSIGIADRKLYRELIEHQDEERAEFFEKVIRGPDS